MDFFKEVMDVGRRTAVDALQSSQIDHDSPFSPEVPEDLRHSMPDLLDRFPLVFPWTKPEPVDPAVHTVWLLDNTAFRTPQPGDKRPDLADLINPKSAQPARISEDGGKAQPVRGGSGWEVEFVACYFVKNSGKDVSRVVGHIAHELQINDDDVATKKRIAERLQPFLDTILPKRTVRIAIDDKEQQTLGPSSYSGISSGLHQLHFNPSPSPFTSNTLTLPPPFSIPSTTVPAEERGWGVISDIDDTIKITNTPSPLGVLHATFIVETPEPVPGMPALYSHIQSTLQTPPFFYLSASPYNLYPFLRHFREAHYPHGTMILVSTKHETCKSHGLTPFKARRELAEPRRIDRLPQPKHPSLQSRPHPQNPLLVPPPPLPLHRRQHAKGPRKLRRDREEVSRLGQEDFHSQSRGHPGDGCEVE